MPVGGATGLALSGWMRSRWRSEDRRYSLGRHQHRRGGL